VKIDPKIDALFQLPLDEFTQKRNALAKELSGESKKQVKFLTKPPLPIWAVNQLFWHDRPTYNALIDASEKLRTTHRSLLSGLSGPKADVRKAEAVHRAALEKAVGKTIALLEQSQGQISDAARETVRKTLAALPTDEAPGRLTRAPEAVGFSLLTGITGLPRRSTEGAKAGARGAAGAGGAKGAIGAAGLPRRSTEGPKAGARGTETSALKKAEEAAKTEAAARKRAEAAMAAKAAAREKEIAAAERDLRQARKAAEQAKFKVRKLTVDLERAQADEEKRAGDVSAAERKLSRLRIAD
jgi:hypothetical protein